MQRAAQHLCTELIKDAPGGSATVCAMHCMFLEHPHGLLWTTTTGPHPSCAGGPELNTVLHWDLIRTYVPFVYSYRGFFAAT